MLNVRVELRGLTYDFLPKCQFDFTKIFTIRFYLKKKVNGDTA